MLQDQTVCNTPKKKASIVTIILCALLVLSVIGNIILLIPKDSEPVSQTLEGSGFDSPEAAITAYAKALSEGDVEGMLRTFAIESYVENYDLEAQIKRVGFYLFTPNEAGLPNDSQYKQELNNYSRLAAVTTQIINGYFALTGVDNSKTYLPFSKQEENWEETLDDFLEQLESPKLDKKLSSIEIGDVLTAEDLLSDESYEVYDPESPYGDFLDVEEFYDLAIEIAFDGEDYYLFMLTAKIDGKWYNITTHSPLAVQSCLDSTTGILKR